MEVSLVASVDTAEQTKGHTINLLQEFDLHKTPNSIVYDFYMWCSYSTAFLMSGFNDSKNAALQLFDCYQAENADVRVMNVYPEMIATDVIEQTKGLFKVEVFNETSLLTGFVVWAMSKEAGFLKGRTM